MIYLLQIAVLSIISMGYLFFMYKLIFIMINPSIKNSASTILRVGFLASSAVNLYAICQSIIDCLNYYVSKSEYLEAIAFSLGTTISIFIISAILIRSSFYIVGIFTKEDEMQEINNNNIELTLMHSTIVITISALIAPVLANLAESFISYPTVPF